MDSTVPVGAFLFCVMQNGVTYEALCPVLLSCFHVSATAGQISMLAFVLTYLCPTFSALWLFSLFQNYLISGWHKLASVMAKFGQD